MELKDVNIDTNKIIMAVLFFLAGWVWNINTEFKVRESKQDEIKEDVEFLFDEEDKTKEKNAKFWEDKSNTYEERYLDLLEYIAKHKCE